MDISIPRILTDVDVVWYTNCSGVATQLKTAIIDDKLFTANPVICTFGTPETPIIVTHVYPSVTLTSLTEGQVVTYVYYLAIKIVN